MLTELKFILNEEINKLGGYLLVTKIEEEIA